MGKREPAIKKKFVGYFNFQRQIFNEWCYAYSELQAKWLLARKIAKKQEVLPVVVMGYLKDHPGSWEIKQEV